MTSNASHRLRGAKWELEVARYLGGERRRLHGADDTGDVAGLPGVVCEAKASGTMQLAAWQRQLRAEVDADSARLGLLAIKAKGHTRAEDGYWMVDPRHVPWIIQNALRGSQS